MSICSYVNSICLLCQGGGQKNYEAAEASRKKAFPMRGEGFPFYPSGSVTVNAVPSPSALWTVIFPLCRSTMAAAIASPKP